MQAQHERSPSNGGTLIILGSFKRHPPSGQNEPLHLGQDYAPVVRPDDFWKHFFRAQAPFSRMNLAARPINGCQVLDMDKPFLIIIKSGYNWDNGCRSSRAGLAWPS
jgi:hypothetical protein